MPSPVPVNRTPRIRRDLMKGLPVSAVAARNGVSPRYVYEVIGRYDLPRNRPISPNGAVEKAILKTLKVTGKIDAAARIHSQAPAAIKRLMREAKGRVPRKAANAA